MTERLRICQLITELAPAGAEQCVYELARRLDRQRFDVRVVALRGGAVADWLTREGIPVTLLNVRGRWDAGKLFHLARMLRREQIDILHTHLFHADFAGRLAAGLAGVPHVVHTVHTAEMRPRRGEFTFARLAAGRCERIVAVSASAAEHHSRMSGLGRSRYTVIPNGVDAAAYQRDEQRREQLRREWGIGERPLAAYVGRLGEEKGVDTLLAAWRELYGCGRAVDLVIAGDGELRGMVERFLAEPAAAGVRMLGFTDDVRGVLSAADLLVMPSHWEGFGLAAAEAMAAGLPVVATDVPGLREVVADGQTGLLVSPGEAAAVADAVMQLADDPAMRRRMGELGCARVIEHFSIDATIATHERLYAEVVHGLHDPLV